MKDIAFLSSAVHVMTIMIRWVNVSLVIILVQIYNNFCQLSDSEYP